MFSSKGVACPETREGAAWRGDPSLNQYDYSSSNSSEGSRSAALAQAAERARAYVAASRDLTGGSAFAALALAQHFGLRAGGAL